MTSRQIEINLESHLAGTVHTVAYLMKVTPVGENAPPEFGVIGLDYSEVYDDLTPSGALVYSNQAGFVPTAMKTSADLSVDNAQAEILIPGFSVDPMTIKNIRAGRYTGAKFVMYLVNYKDMQPGRHMEEFFGTLGRIEIVNNLVCFPELRGPTQAFRQTCCNLDSFTCRRRFGDDICGIDLAPLWQTSAVSVVGAEADRTFRLTGITPPSQGFAPGMANFLSGDNEGREFEIEAWTNVGAGVVEITLAHATDFLITLATSVRIRPDCRKRFIEDCKNIYDNVPQFDGEPDIPIGDEGAAAVPGASLSSGSGFSGVGIADAVDEA